MPVTNTLGNGQYRALIQTRCGTHYLFELQDLLDLSYSRVLNDISSAELNVSFRQCALLSAINPWEHEVAIFRNDVLVWVGPIIDMTFDQGEEKITIEAKDLLTWADHRLVELADIDYDPDSTDLTDAYIWLLEHAYCKDPWCMTWSIDPVGIPVSRYYPSFARSTGERWGGVYVSCGEEMRALSGSGIDYTVINRHLWGGSTQVVNPVASGIVLLDRHFHAPPVVKVAGAKMATRFVSAGGQGGFSGYYDDQLAIYPSTNGPITPALLDETQRKYGLLETFSTVDIYDDVDTTSDPNPVAQDAKSRWDLLHQPYTYVDEGTLSDDAPLSFNQDLIPGAVFTVLLSESCRSVSDGLVRLQEVAVSTNGETEEVRISLTPLGTTTS